jgi:hypothetical protein
MARGQHMGSVISYPQPSLLCELRWVLVKVAQEVVPELIQKILIAGNQTSADQIAKGAGKGEIKSVIFLLAHKSTSPSPLENGDDLLADVLRLADRIGAGVRVEPAKRWVSKRSPANHKSVIGGGVFWPHHDRANTCLSAASRRPTSRDIRFMSADKYATQS